MTQTPDPVAPAAPKRPRRAAALFTLGAAIVVALAIAVLSFDRPLTRLEDPQTDNAYVGGDIVRVAARVQGYLVALPIADDQQVHAGDLIAEIEPDDYRANVQQATAAVAAAEAQVAVLAAQRAELAAQVGQAESQEASRKSDTVRTAPELARQERLIGTEVGLRRALDQAQAQQRQSEAGMEGAHASLTARLSQYDTLAAQQAQAAATVQARRADLRLQQINLGWTRILAPADGTLGARAVRVGDLLQPGATVATLSPLDTVWVDANFTERQIPAIRIGQPARLRVDAFPGQTLAGHVTGLSPTTGSQVAALPADNATGNFTKVVQRVIVRIAIDWAGSPLRGLVRPGMSVVATVLTRND